MGALEERKITSLVDWEGMEEHRNLTDVETMEKHHYMTKLWELLRREEVE